MYSPDSIQEIVELCYVVFNLILTSLMTIIVWLNDLIIILIS